MKGVLTCILAYQAHFFISFHLFFLRTAECNGFYHLFMNFSLTKGHLANWNSFQKWSKDTWPSSF